MAEDAKFDDAEKAYAAAAAEVKPSKAEAEAKDSPAPAKAQAAETSKPVEAEPKSRPKVAATAKAQATTAKPAKTAKLKKVKPAAKNNEKPVATKRATVKARPAPARRKVKIARRAAAPKAAANANLTVTELKEKIMTAKNTNDFAQPIADAFGEYQNRAQAAYAKGTEALSEATEFAKGNVEALVESTKIFAAGVQDLGRTYVEEAKSAYETVTADVKELAAVKSPTELFQLQGKIARRNFDAMIATSSKNTDAFLKLATDAFAPITGRVTLATEKLAQVA